MDTMIPIHIAGGSVALIAGAAALFLFRKGGRLHGQWGTIFFAGMLVLGGTGALIAAVKPERGTMMIGLLVCYLVITSWVTVRRRDGEAGRFERYAFAFALAWAITMLGFGIQGLNSPDGRVDSLPAAVHFPFAALMALAATLDLNFLLRGTLTPPQRIARHLWRMCAALLIAAFSFFLGQQKVMPEFIQGSPLLFVPPLATLAAMLFWIFRVRFSKAFSRYPSGRGRPHRAVVAEDSAPVSA